jgi:hypothetical protein
MLTLMRPSLTALMKVRLVTLVLVGILHRELTNCVVAVSPAKSRRFTKTISRTALLLPLA